MTFRRPEENPRRRTAYWGAFIAVAILFHSLLFIGVRQGFFEVFRTAPGDESAPASRSSSFADAMTAITIEIIEGDEPAENDRTIQTIPQPPTPVIAPPQTGSGDSPLPDLDLDALTGQAETRVPQEGSGRETRVPPRPVEITWPETRGLGHCLGLGITVKIEVGASGRVIQVEATDTEMAADCVAAALEAARQIRFEPGRVKGRPQQMWTELRIDFRKRR